MWLIKQTDFLGQVYWIMLRGDIYTRHFPVTGLMTTGPRCYMVQSVALYSILFLFFLLYTSLFWFLLFLFLTFVVWLKIYVLVLTPAQLVWNYKSWKDILETFVLSERVIWTRANQHVLYCPSVHHGNFVRLGWKKENRDWLISEHTL